MQSKATNAPSPQQFISRADAAKLLGMTVQFVDKKIADGTLPYYRFGRSVRLRRDEFERWVAGKRVQL